MAKHELVALRREVFSDYQASVFAVLDGAAIPALLDRLEQHAPEHICLYRGELAPDLLETAPYLVQLERNAEFTTWLLDEGWGKSWGIFAVSPADLQDLRKHFRSFLMVKDPDGKQMYFRYYDPRVLRVFLPACNPEELSFLFGPVTSYYAESEDAKELVQFRNQDGGIRTQTTPIAREGP